jgi:hypothetical protein
VQPAHSHWKFVADKRPPIYKTLAAELDAIRDGKKAISYFATDRDGLHEDHAVIQKAADKRELEVSVAKRGEAFDIFVHRANTAKRVPQLLVALSRKPWSFEHEATLGKLLGYTPAQRKAWLAAEHHARPAFGVLTLYGTIGVGYGAPNWWWIEPGRVPAPDAYAKRTKGERLYRVGVDPRYAKKLDKKGHAILSSFVKRRAFDKVVRTPYEWLGAKGWERAGSNFDRR